MFFQEEDNDYQQGKMMASYITNKYGEKGTDIIEKEPPPCITDWNIIPYGDPSECRQKLMLILDGNFPSYDLISRALHHIYKTCKPITKTLFIYVDISDNEWQYTCQKYELAFDELENNGIELKIIFNNFTDEYLGLARVTEVRRREPAAEMVEMIDIADESRGYRLDF